MSDAPFLQTSSFTRQLKVVLATVAGFFLVGLFVLHFSSQGLLRGLRELNSANQILSLTTMAMEGLDASEQVLDKALAGGDPVAVRDGFRAGRDSVRRHIAAAARMAPDDKLRVSLEKAGEALDAYGGAAESLFQEMGRGANAALVAEDLEGDMLVARQFAMDAKEALRATQIGLDRQGRLLFQKLYAERFTPLAVATILAVVFFTLVLGLGSLSTRRLARSLATLKSAAEAVGRGDLHYRAPIVAADEFGRLTFEFNRMAQNLEEKREQLRVAMGRVTRLQSITASLSEALLPDQVYDVVFREAFEALGAVSGAVATLHEENAELHIQRIEGYHEVWQERWKRIPLKATLPMPEVARTRKSLFIGSAGEVRARYAALELPDETSGALAVLPLMVGSEVLGTLALSFGRDKAFKTEEREFMLALARQCSQALHRAQLFAAAKEAIHVRDEFLSIASHELKTPLTPLKLQLQTLSRWVKKGTLPQMPPQQLIKTFDSSDQQVTRLTHLIDDLLDVSRITAGKFNLTRETVNLAEVVEDVVKSYGHQLEDLGCPLELHLDRSITGLFDRVRMEQVLINLLMNAAKYAPGRPVTVRLSRQGSVACLAVRDRGRGIPRSEQGRIFERFERVRDRNNVGGLGLGLFISRQIVEAHHGDISVQSEPGEGATFIVKVPIVASLQEAEVS